MAPQRLARAWLARLDPSRRPFAVQVLTSVPPGDTEAGRRQYPMASTTKAAGKAGRLCTSPGPMFSASESLAAGAPRLTCTQEGRLRHLQPAQGWDRDRQRSWTRSTRAWPSRPNAGAQVVTFVHKHGLRTRRLSSWSSRCDVVVFNLDGRVPDEGSGERGGDGLRLRQSPS